jgi:hypothetical protein
MSRIPGASLPGMTGGGFYNLHSTLQDAAIRKVLPLWRESLQDVALADRDVTIVDYGSSEGRNSMAPIGAAIDCVRQRTGAETPISIIHTDLPGNDFSTLFRTLIESEDSYQKRSAEIFSSAIGRSYFEQILPADSVNIAWNSWTLQWMSENPVEDPDFLYGAYSPNEWVRAAVAQRLDKDWREFLRLRAIELAPGGRMLCLFGSKSDTILGWEWIAGALWQVVLDMWREGSLSDAEKLRINLPLGPRDVDAIRQPFGREGVFSGLRLLHAEVMASPDPYWPEYLKTTNAGELGENWKNFMRAVFAPVLQTQLDPSKEPAARVDEIFTRFAAVVASSPRETEHYVGIAIVEKIIGDGRGRDT